MINIEAAVREFHEKFGLPAGFNFMDQKRRKLRRKLVWEEFEELMEAEHDQDIIEVADGIADLVYVLVGMAIEYGLPFNEIFAEVHRSNMTKLWPDGKPRYREDGKILKPKTYSPPKIYETIKMQEERGKS